MILAHNALLWLQIAAIAFFGSLAVTGFMRMAGLGDPAGKRSAHSGIIPTSGGVGIIAGLGLGLMTTALIFPDLRLHAGFATSMSLIFAMGLLGLTDDRMTLGPKLKFGIMILICAVAVREIGPPESIPGFYKTIDLPIWLGFGGAVFWLFLVTNIVNFMDGANGMIGLTMSVAFTALFGLGLVANSTDVCVLSAILLMSILGFLPYNSRRKAQIFCGDVGSLMIGFSYALAVLFLINQDNENNFHWAGVILILPFLVDTLMTIARRILKRENILLAHNQHLYQRLIKRGGGHLSVSGLYAILALVCANIVLLGITRDWFQTPRLFFILAGMFIAGWFLLGRPSRNSRDDITR